jgi:hypothetical protein
MVDYGWFVSIAELFPQGRMRAPVLDQVGIARWRGPMGSGERHRLLLLGRAVQRQHDDTLCVALVDQEVALGWRMRRMMPAWTPPRGDRPALERPHQGWRAGAARSLKVSRRHRTSHHEGGGVVSRIEEAAIDHLLRTGISEAVLNQRLRQSAGGR